MGSKYIKYNNMYNVQYRVLQVEYSFYTWKQHDLYVQNIEKGSSKMKGLERNSSLQNRINKRWSACIGLQYKASTRTSSLPMWWEENKKNYIGKIEQSIELLLWVPLFSDNQTTNHLWAYCAYQACHLYWPGKHA